jgi:alanyl-tRNA synthetase
MARELNFAIDEQGFNSLMDKQKSRGREASKDKFASVNVNLTDLSGFDLLDSKPTTFTGYDELRTKAIITGIKSDSENTLVILDRSPFYVESGGQTDDLGKLVAGDNSFDVVDVAKIDNQIVHVIKSEYSNNLKVGQEVIAEVDENRRWDIMRNHSVTHFLHKALRTVLGTHVQQAGSYVGPDRLRFDFTHFAKLTTDEIQEIEAMVNKHLRKNLPLTHHRNTPFEEAQKMGALMFFGDKYGDKVNVVQFGDYTMEFCGGTHVHNSSEIGLFKILSEASIASGVRRIEAVTGTGVEKFIHSQQEHIQLAEQKVEELLDIKKKLEKEIAELKVKENLGQLDHILSLSSEEKHIAVYKGKVHADSMDELKSFGDEMRNRIKSGVGVLIAQIDDKVGIVAVVSDDLIKDKKLSAGKIVGELAKLVGGGGGGRPHLATAGGKDVNQIATALSKVEKIVGSFL